jgi:hypothetical protein
MLMNVDLTQPALLPMYALPEMEGANSAFLAALRRRLRVKNFDTAEDALGSNHGAVLKGSRPGVLFTQMCGYPLFKYHRNQYRILATPHYAFPGCVESRHRAFSWSALMIQPNAWTICADACLAATAYYRTPA